MFAPNLGTSGKSDDSPIPPLIINRFLVIERLESLKEVWEGDAGVKKSHKKIFFAIDHFCIKNVFTFLVWSNGSEKKPDPLTY